MNSHSPLDWHLLEELVRRDPAGRGLASYRDAAGAPLVDDLAAAALDLAHRATRVLVVTGFAIATPDGLRAETDGPPGALFLAGMLRACEVEVDIATDELAAPVLLAGLRAASATNPALADVGLIALPASFSYDDRDALLAVGYSHLIAIERVGPNHTVDSIAAQDAVAEEDDEPQLFEFEELVDPADRDTCRNMRGEPIDEFTPPLHLLFERDEPVDQESDDDEQDDEEPPDDFDGDDDAHDFEYPTTIGIADGGNEIGCGKLRWSVLRRAVARGPAELTACRIATDYLIVSGISNWGGYALGAAAVAIRDRRAALEAWTREREAAIICAMVAEAGAVDGTLKRPEFSVDGIGLVMYLDTFDAIRRTCLGE